MDCTTRTKRRINPWPLLAALLLSSATSANEPLVNQAEELPQGLAIVPWKKSTSGRLDEGPVRLVEEPLRAIDPEVFRRQLKQHAQTQSSPASVSPAR